MRWLPLLLLAGCFPPDGREDAGVLTVDLQPDEPGPLDDLYVAVRSATPDFQVTWTRNGQPVPEWDGWTTLPQAHTEPGDRFEVTALALWNRGPGDRVTDEVVVGNNKPKLTVSLSPSEPREGHDIVATGVVTDPDYAQQHTIDWVWYVNGREVDAPGNVAPDRLWAKGDVVRAVGVVTDGLQTATAQAEVTVMNTPPTMGSAKIQPDGPTENSVLTCVDSELDDADDDDVAFITTWRVGNQTYNQATLDGTHFDKGDEITCTLVPTDGESDGTATTSPPEVVTNTPPVFQAVTIGPDPPREDSVMTATFTGWDDPDPGDNEAYLYTWSVNGDDVGDGLTLTGDLFQKGDSIQLEVSAYDGEVGTTLTSNLVTVENSAPTLSMVTITPDVATTDTRLSFVTDAADGDGDNLALSYTWTINGGGAGNSPSMDPGIAVRGDVVVLSITATDGAASVGPVTDTVTIANALPEVYVQVDPGADASTDLSCAIDGPTTDADGDAITYDIAWLLEGAPTAWVLTNGTNTDTLTVPSANLTDGQTWTCEVRADDGYEPFTTDLSVTLGACRSLYFDGTDDYVRVPNSSDFDGLTELSVSAWVWPESGNPGVGILTKRDELVDDPVFALSNATGAKFEVWTTDGPCEARSTDGMGAAHWVLVTGTYDGRTISIWQDGVRKRSNPCTGDVVTRTGADNTLHIGEVDGNSWGGQIDDVRLYDRVLNDSEILTMLAGGDALTNGLISHWDFQDAGTTLVDRVGTNDGTVFGAVWDPTCPSF